MPCLRFARLRFVGYSVLMLLASVVFCAPSQALESRPFANLAFQDEKGETHRLHELQGKFTIVHFWATWCGPCVQELPVIDALQAEYAAKGLKIIAISPEGHSEVDAIQKFYKENHITHLDVFTDDGAATQKAHLHSLPASYFIDADGKLVDTSVGVVNWSAPEIRALITQFLK